MSQEHIIFTDLDGSLLNHEDYSFDEAKEMLGFIKEKKIPLVYTTSKTKNECLKLQDEMDIDDPFIVENGAAIYFSDGTVELLGVEHRQIKEFMDSVAEEFRILSFSNMRVEDIMEYTLFSYQEAKEAKSREFSEPFLIRDERRLTELEVLAESFGLKILKGGRFYHCVGVAQDKGEALKRTLKRYPNRVSIALGDNYNDISMLKVVDIPILIPHHEGKYIDFRRKNLILAPDKGSLGWSKALKKVLA